MTRVIATDVVVIGTGPAGWTAALYLARAGLQPLVITGPQTGGQLTITTEVENWPGGSPDLTGPSLMADMEAQVRRLGVEVIVDIVTNVRRDESLNNWPIKITTETDIFVAKAVIVASGSSAKYLGLESEELYKGRGVSACATCDGFFYRNKNVIVVGGGNTAVEEAIYLSKIAREVTMFVRGSGLRAEAILQKRLVAIPNIRISLQTELAAVFGDLHGVTGVAYRHAGQDGVKEFPGIVDGVFIAIGHEPNTGFLANSGVLLNNGYIQLVGNTYGDKTATTVEGIYAAGDVADPRYRQAITSAGSGCAAALDVIKYLELL